MNLHERLKIEVSNWKKKGYTSGYSAIAEIIEWQILNGKNGSSALRYLRKPQLEALETYWYLRLETGTPHIFDLYKNLIPDPSDLLSALGIPITNEKIVRLLVQGRAEAVLEKIRTDDEFVRQFRLNAVRETLALAYPSYILALAMGAGKTVLIGSIIATEFAMALEYPDGPFVKNALVFAPGKTILGALKELSDVPYEKILPPRLYKQFISTLKITYTRDGQKNIPVLPGSSFNLIVTNTEKIRITKQSITKGLLGGLFSADKEEEVKEDVANQRLKTIASLPNLAIFSDEAHHTYGQALNTELKQVRKTVDYLAQNTDVKVVVNTTGTPYYRRQILKDVVYWYGLSQGIRDGILKEVRGNIMAFPKIETHQLVSQILKDFFEQYGEVKIHGNIPAKIALYFPQTSDIDEIKPVVERTLISLKYNPSIALAVTNESDEKTKDLFNNRVNDPALPYRVFLLVNMGTEGWNVPSLFSTALVREIRSSNNFVLQAASRCLRQVPDNPYKAKIYLAQENVAILDSELQETFGETLADLNAVQPEMKKARLTIRKLEIPPVLMRKRIQRVVPLEESEALQKIDLVKPNIASRTVEVTLYGAQDRGPRKRILEEVGTKTIVLEEETTDSRELAAELANVYRFPYAALYEKLTALYGENDITESEAKHLREQVEQQARKYKITQEEIEMALALVRKEGFDETQEDNKKLFVTEIQYRKDKENLLLQYEVWRSRRPRQGQLYFGFHYTPYNFDSNPEQDFFVRMLEAIEENPADVEDIYFTGAMDDPNKTDFLFEYQDKDGKWHNYAPDFLIRKKDGKMLIVEVKAEDRLSADKTMRKEKAMREIEGLNPDTVRYEIIETERDAIKFTDLDKIKKLVYAKENSK